MAADYKAIRAAANAYRTMFVGVADQIVLRHARDADDEVALKAVRELAVLGSLVFTGCYFHAALEELLWKIGERATAEEHASCGAKNRERRRVLHVVTEVYATGGHTRCLLDWIHADTSSEHGLALTEHAGSLPAIFWREQVELGSIHYISECTLVEGVKRLVKVAAEYDIVVFHQHPYDAVAAASCASLTKMGCKTIFFNHASHSFAVGSTLASQAVAFSKGSAEYAQHYLPYDDIGVLPFLGRREAATPLDVAMAQAMRVKHGIGEKQVVVATVGTKLKFGDIKQNALFKRLAELMADCPNVCFLVGVNDHAYAAQLGRAYPQFNVEQTNERLVALKMIADIYLDSMPVGGGLTHFEFATWGVPVLSNYRSSLGKGRPSRCVDGAPDELAVTSKKQHREMLKQLVADAELRRAYSDRMLAAIDNRHSSAVYRNALDSIYAKPALQERLPSKSCEVWDRAKEFLAWKQLSACGNLEIRLRSLLWCITAPREQMTLTDYATARSMCLAPLKALRVFGTSARSTWVRDILSYCRVRLRRLLSKA